MKVLVDGQLIEYKDEGSGRVLLFLHGWGTSLGTFDRIVVHLAKEFRVIRFDFPGFGQSPKPPDDWSVRDYARLTSNFLEKLKITELHAIIGHSFGGRVVIKYFSLGYLEPKKVVLIAAAGVKPRQSLKKGLYKRAAKIGKLTTSIPVLKKAQPVLRKYLHLAAGSTDYLQAGHMQKVFLNVINEDLLPEVSLVTQPTLLIWGKDDTETPLSDANSMLKSLNKGRLVVIPDSGHFVYTEAYDEVNKELDGFLS
ncbi:alpha/beta hydrolase [Candidatus Saccharibacteria bacterium]|nr:alpha/beta hydrolase [Candidatus Saccharibacteria bacterium]